MIAVEVDFYRRLVVRELLVNQLAICMPNE